MPRERKSRSPGQCPACGRHALERRYIREEFDYGPEDERVRVIAEGVPVFVCPSCEEVFYGPEAEQAHHRAICQTLGLLTPEQIRGVRERLGLRQAEFAQLTGIGVATLSRWEKGRLIQTRSMDNYLQLLEALPDAIRVLEKRRGSSARGQKPWRCLQMTDEIRARRVRFEQHFYHADPSSRSEPKNGSPNTSATADSARS